MLKLVIPSSEEYDPVNNIFKTYPEQTLSLEHSLVSVSKWESKWHKPFLRKDPMTADEMIDYIRCMTLTRNVDDSVYDRLTLQNHKDIADYISSPMTATTFSSRDQRAFGREIITSEIIYYWMVALNIPFECQKWHLNRLITLIRVTSIKQSPSKKMSKKDIMARNRSLNAVRRRANNSKG